MREISSSLREVVWAGGFLLLLGAFVLFFHTLYMSIRTNFHCGIRPFGFALKLITISMFLIGTRYMDICTVGLPTILIMLLVRRLAPDRYFINLCLVYSKLSENERGRNQ